MSTRSRPSDAPGQRPRASIPRALRDGETLSLALGVRAPANDNATPPPDPVSDLLAARAARILRRYAR